MRLPRRKQQRGQGTVELVLTMLAFFTIFFMFVQVSLSMAVANFIQYATFMSARAFQAGYPTLSEQKEAAASVITKMLKPGGKDRFPAIAKGEGGGDIEGASIGPSARAHLAPAEDARDTSWEQGVTYTFKVKMYLAPMVPGVNQGADSHVTLESQSLLGREPTEEECVKGLADRQKKSSIKSHQFIFDNGC